MTYFHIELDLTCPSGWTEADVRAYIERICPTKGEKGSIQVSTVEGITLPCQRGLHDRCYSPGDAQCACSCHQTGVAE